ncbi:MAG: hypothetical protein JNK53_00720, partial [Phycisphaerae bacterium]|nr:hypothetical protein [Phycisphaerae bacterium]
APDKLQTAIGHPWSGAPWRAKGDAAAWKLAPSRAWQFNGSGESGLEWRSDTWPVDDWSAYNALRYSGETQAMMVPGPAPRADWWRGLMFPVSDLRLTASIECADLANFSTAFELRARKQLFQFEVRGNGTATVKRSVAETGEVRESATYAFAPSGNGTLSLEFWHVDQQLWMFVNGSLLGSLPYEFASMSERLESSMARTRNDDFEKLMETNAPFGPVLAWNFNSAAPFTLHRVRVDRDLYYRPNEHTSANQVNLPRLSGPAFATDWKHPAQLGADDFLMLGDNSSHSRDSRLWGNAHPLSIATFGDSQPGVVPRPMIVGKAWCVYFPAPMPITPGTVSIIPDFGRVRFIR